MPCLCMNRAAARTRIRIHVRVRAQARSPSKQYKKTASFIVKSEEKSDEFSFNSYLTESESGNRVMVVNLLLTPLLKLMLLYNGLCLILFKARTQSFFYMLRNKVHVEMAVRGRKDKGAIIVEEAKRLRAALLVLGQRKPSLLRRLQTVWGSRRAVCRVVDYCIQNANCMTTAVRRKHKKYGGYFITTKRHSNFWLLA